MLLKAIIALDDALRGEKYYSLRKTFRTFIVMIIKPQLKDPTLLSESMSFGRIIKVLRENFAKYYQEVEKKALAKGRAEGQAKGRAEGLAQGLAQGQLKLLKHQLNTKFGSKVTRVGLTERLRNATPEQIELRGCRILKAKAIDEVFVDD
ncbi:MAG: hypothetical protein LBP22_03225 [Deltaproteobacteria bacterium]|nr:hypothetical protein [Deltaproteobacteria bacterium]